MKFLRCCWWLALLLMTAGCNQTRAVSESTPAPLLAANTQSKNIIRTEPLAPQPIRINLQKLPPPFATKSASKRPEVVSIPQNPVLRVPPGFQVNVFAEGLDAPRWLALTPSGDVLVTETRENRIRLLRDSNGDGVADVSQTFASADNGLNIPFGMAFAGNYFFLGNTDEVLRFPYSKGQKQLSGTGTKIADLPGGGYNQHWTRNVIAAPDGKKLYVSVGSRSNVDEEELPRASVQVMNLDGSQKQTFAFGLRNPVGLDFHPVTKELYTTVNERDGIGDDLVPDYFTRIQQGEFYGWPYTYLTPNKLDPRQTANGKSKRPDLAARTRTPDVLFQAHSAALGVQFYDGKSFPEKYKNGAFVAFRGSWNRDRGTGYKVVFVPFNTQGRPQGNYEDFLTGFLLNPSTPTTWGRPVGLLVLPDGSLLVTEEANNRIYRIQYVGNQK
ncbi:sorbosone dehydrogenase family protein [Nostoc sp. FACHB-87]|uniref:PQQ-dependent sugar dehydrogenase n=1 Tax=Nostocales TaxID=1161 RepID=UPI001685CAF9|nr:MULTISPECIES: sorbosone dehydrogenase family protein [Nostocales]MBD2452486.1 sorbosone dehydrogenase family protein [Nostoc sp. FACHB-87]MBD2473416.1 sorbosone dehydrogenase family protein [Anabaena sp. FACHB-83]MBD2486079.1 sorbosone dehydrogenase family protein [Aulosira sp. FACHB-615]